MQCTWAAGAFRRKAAIAAVIVCAAAGDGAARGLLVRVTRVDRWVAIAVAGPLALYLAAAIGVTLLGGHVELDAKGRDARADVYGSLLGTCAHSVLRDR